MEHGSAQTAFSKLYGKGIFKTKAGHLRFSSPKELRGEYVHRHVVNKLAEETPYSIRLLLPWPFEVHHIDYNKQCNCPWNLMMIGTSLHSVMTADRGRRGDGRFRPKWKEPPKWLPLYDEGLDGEEYVAPTDTDNPDSVPF